MHVNSISNNPYLNNNLSFKHWNRTVYNYLSDGKKCISHRNDTYFFRDNELWRDFVLFFTDKFKHLSKVNVYDYGCSNGEEIYTFLMCLSSMFPEEVINKFSNITAKDIDEVAIKKALQNLYTINCKEQINLYTRNKFNIFFIQKKYTPGDSFILYKVIKELYDKVNFSVGDIKKDYINITPNNNIIFMRNFLPYIDNWGERQQLLRNIGKQLHKDSFIVIGEYDVRGTNYKINNEIIDAGFTRTRIPYVFEKIY